MWLILDGSEYLPALQQEGMSPSTIKRLVARILYDEYDVDTVYGKPTIPETVSGKSLNALKPRLTLIGAWIQEFRRRHPGVVVEIDVEQTDFDLIIGLGALRPWPYTYSGRL